MIFTIYTERIIDGQYNARTTAWMTHPVSTTTTTIFQRTFANMFWCLWNKCHHVKSLIYKIGPEFLWIEKKSEAPIAYCLH